MKACESCYYCIKIDAEGFIQKEFWRCGLSWLDDVITGRPINEYCSTQRAFGKCGKDGNLHVDRKEREDEINIDCVDEDENDYDDA